MSSLIVRPLTSPEEYRIYFDLADKAFSTSPSEESVQRWQRIATQSPGFRSEQLRGAFRDGQLLGGYMFHERVMCMGDARLSTGCIGAVVTAPEARKQGVASALLRDAQEFARQNKHALLLLDGIPKFYYRFGYTDVFDVSALEIDRSALLAQAPTDYILRTATGDDAAEIFALYERHCGRFTGSFERSLALQAYRLQNARVPPLVALAPNGKVEGYLYYGTGDERIYGYEIAADTWQALLSLLHYHAHLLDDDPAARTLLYFLPLDSPMTHWLIDTLEVPDTSQWNSGAMDWGLRSLVYHHRFTGWMAALVDFSAVMHALLPELRERWRRSLAHWTGEVTLQVEGQSYTLDFNEREIGLLEVPMTAAASHVQLSAQEFLQAIFGYRPLLRQPSLVPSESESRAALAILFPAGHTWMPRTDWF